FDEDRLTGEVRHVLVRSRAKGELYLVIVVAKDEKPRWLDAAIEKLAALEKPPVRIALNVSPQRERKMMLSDETRILRGPAHYRTEIEEITYHVSPSSFFQTNKKNAA